ncbi:MAG TPA: phosphatase PAP2 family protein [Sphingobacteriaceae bacterium]
MKSILVAIITWVKRVLRDRLHLRSEELPYYITIGIALILFGVALDVFIELTDELAENELGSFDNTVSNYVVSFRSSSLTPFFRFMTDMGDRFAYIIITIALGGYLFLRHKNWKFIAQTVLVLLLSTVTNILLKSMINRARPAHEHLVQVNTLSFPSGHSMSAMAFYGFLTYLAIVSRIPMILKVVLTVVLIITILSIGISRIYLGVHYPSDVAAGFLGGLIWVTFCIVVFEIFSLLRKRKSQVVTG